MCSFMDEYQRCWKAQLPPSTSKEVDKLEHTLSYWLDPYSIQLGANGHLVVVALGGYIQQEKELFSLLQELIDLR